MVGFRTADSTKERDVERHSGMWKSLRECSAALCHVGAIACAACSIYLFVVAAIDDVIAAFTLFGVAIALEAIAAVIRRNGPISRTGSSLQSDLLVAQQCGEGNTNMDSSGAVTMPPTI